MGSRTSPPRPIRSPVLNPLQPVPRRLVPPSYVCPKDYDRFPTLLSASLPSDPLPTVLPGWFSAVACSTSFHSSLSLSAPTTALQPAPKVLSWSAVTFSPPFSTCLLSRGVQLSGWTLTPTCSHLSVPWHTVLCEGNSSRYPCCISSHVWCIFSTLHKAGAQTMLSPKGETNKWMPTTW